MSKGLFFKSNEHRSCFLTAMQSLGRIDDRGQLDQEYAAALYILTADTWIWEAAQCYVSKHGIGFEALIDQPLSSSELVLLQWAANLFNPLAAEISPVELMRLDDANFLLALTAVQIRRRAWPVSAFQEGGEA